MRNRGKPIAATHGTRPKSATARGASDLPVLDSSFLIDLQDGLPAARNAMSHLENLALVVPGHAALEVMTGDPLPLAMLQTLRDGYRVILAGDAQLAVAARIRADARSQGRRPSWGDVYIAAEAHLSSTYVVTADARDFKILGCQVWEYRKGGVPPE